MKKTLTLFLMTTLALAGQLALAADTVIIQTSFVSTGSRAYVNGTQSGLSVNLPGGNWIWGAGWNWSAPCITATWDGLKDCLTLGEEKSIAALSLASAGSYVKPTALTVEATIASSQKRGGVGFWPTVPARSDANTWSTGFSGIKWTLDSTPNVTLLLYANGVAQGSGVVLPANASGVGTLRYTVDTVDGSIDSAYWNDAAISGFPSTTAFTDAATAYVGPCSTDGGGGNTPSYSSFKVTAPVASSLPEIKILNATNETHTAVQLNGKILSAGTTPYSVTVYWGTTDGTNNPTAWDQSLDITSAISPAANGAFSYTLQGLTRNTTYFARFGIQDAANVTDYGTNSVQFTTTGLPVVSALPVENRSVVNGTADAIGSLSDLGAGTEVSVSIAWGLAGSLATTNVVGTYTSAPSSLSYGLTGLSTGNTYAYQFIASSEVGISVSTVKQFVLAVVPTNGAVIVNAPFAQYANAGTLPGTTKSLSVNLPGGVWGCAYSWYTPTVDWQGVLGQQGGGYVALPVWGGDYLLPTSLTVKAKVAGNGTAFIGFVSQTNNTMTLAYFTGLKVNWQAKTLQVYASGALQGSAVHIPLPKAEKAYYELEYAVNDNDGSILYVCWDGMPILGLSSTAFTAANVPYVCLNAGDLSSTYTALSVSAGYTLPQAPSVAIDTPYLTVMLGDPLSVSVSAQTVGGVSLPVTLASTTMSSATFTDGTFSWTANSAGTQTATFTAVNNGLVSTNALTVRVYASAPLEQGSSPIYRTAFVVTNATIQIGSTNRQDLVGNTAYGLVVNRPNGKWIWNTGYSYEGAMPRTVPYTATITLGDEGSSLLLPLASQNGYTKPEKIRIKATFVPTLTGLCGLGFWPSLTQNNASWTGFTGIRLDLFRKTLMLYTNGVAQSSTASFDFGSSETTYAVSYCVDARDGKGTISDVVVNGRLIEGLSSTGFSPTATAYAGLMTGGNTPEQPSRASFSFFQVDEILPVTTLILVR